MVDDLFLSLRRQWTTTAQGYVNPWECDDMGHMNVQFYFVHLHAARVHLAHSSGIGIENLFVSDMLVNFWDELPGSASLQINSAIVESDGDKLKVAHILSDPYNSHPATTFYETWTGTTGQSDTSLDEKGRMFFGIDRTGFDIPDIDLKASQDSEMTVGTRSLVLPSECDENGSLLTRFLVSRLSDGAGFQWRNIAGQDMRAMVAERRGGAVVSYRMKFQRRAQAGDPLESRVGVLKIGGSSYVLGNLMFNTKTGKLIASAETTLVHFDLEARRAIPLTEQMKDHMSKRTIKF